MAIRTKLHERSVKSEQLQTKNNIIATDASNNAKHTYKV